MPMPRRSLILAIGALGAAVAGGVVAVPSASKPPKPIRVPPSPMAPLPPAVIDNSLAIGGEDINARKVETRLTVEVRVNGRGPYRFLVDSGADTSVVGQRIARDLNLVPGTPVILNSMTASALVPRVIVGELALGSSRFQDMLLPVLLERDLGGAGMIGIDALVQQRLMMDFEQRVIKVEDARIPARMMDGEIVVTARRRRGQLILTQVSAAGRQVEAVVDTGSEISIGNLLLRDQLIRGNRDKFVDLEVMGVTGVTIKLQLARISELRLGKVTLRDVPIAFADVPPFRVFGLDKEPALLLGTDLLDTFRRVSLDFRARKVRFQLRKCGSTGIVISTDPSAFTRISSNDDGEVCRR
jgi:predicted aspartyl protease